MIDSHCHLEQKDYDNDRNQVIENCKKELKAIITCCAHPKDFELTMNLVEKHKNFVFACCGIHPEYIKDISEKEIEYFLELLKENKDKIVGIGETGLDYYWTKEKEHQEKQKELFIRLINFAKEIKKPLIIHVRDAFDDAIKILEDQKTKNVLMHLFGSRKHLQNILDNNWYISVGPIIKKSKNHKKIVRDFPLERILLETDSPWFGNGQRGTPLNIKPVADKISQVKKLDFQEIWEKCGQNSMKFFSITPL